MSNKWNSDVGGILRKHEVKHNVENKGSDLLVFGYASKIFRDDERAIFVDQGKHLISWMGDNKLKIDRYDVRATLPDLSQYEPPPGGYFNRLQYLSPAEQKAEQLCEEERYYSLIHNEEEEQMYQEEELKRLHQEASSSYGQVAFDYNAEIEKTNDQEDTKKDEPDEVYIMPVNLNVPTDIETPDTMKLHAIIEKTAKFISNQGAQMEILIKAKQSNNPQFEFLNQNNRLNPYYKFMLQAFKSGAYKTEVQVTPNESQSGSTAVGNQDIQSNSNFMPNSFAYPSRPVPVIKYKPSANCAYTQLISKIKGVPLPPEQPVETKEEKSHIPTLLDYNSYYAHQYNSNETKYTEQQFGEQSSQDVQQKLPVSTEDGVQVNKISTGLMLAQCYASDTEDETDQYQDVESPQVVLNFPIPPDYLQHIIDKTAAYVAKNGKQFEDTLRNKQDDRFLFLDPNNEYHTYYMYKVTGVVQPYPTTNGNVNQDNSKPKLTGPVSFSIKTKDDYSVSLKPALPLETSDDESDLNKYNSTIIQTPSTQFTNATVPEHVQRAIQLVEKQLSVKGAQFSQTGSISGNSSISNSQRSRFDVDNTGTVVNRANPIPTISVKPEVLQQKELKRAEEKVKDRLALIAREKLGLISKEKQLQLERKKKAMVFLTQIKSTGISVSSAMSEDQSKEMNSDLEMDSDKSSVHSIPISGIDDKGEFRISPVKNSISSSHPKSTKRRSRSRERSKEKMSSLGKRKKKSKHHSKKKSKKKSRSRSGSHSRIRERSISRSNSRDRKNRKRSSSRKLKKKRRE